MTAAEAALLSRGAREFGFELGDDALGRLDRFLQLLILWNRRFHLTGERTPSILVRKHIVDSLALVPHLPPAGLVVDVGSGAGFPGIVLGCVRPELRVAMIESRRRPATFLREVVRSVPLPSASVIELRAEDASGGSEVGGRAALVTSRAVAVESFLRLAAPLLAPGGRAVAMQTPWARPRATQAARRHGYDLAGEKDYVLPGGERRSLLFFVRPQRPPASVP